MSKIVRLNSDEDWDLWADEMTKGFEQILKERALKKPEMKESVHGSLDVSSGNAELVDQGSKSK